MAWYAEERFLGIWSPRIYDRAPDTKKVNGVLRIVRSDGTQGREVRAVAEINVGHERLTLLQLSQVYGPDGAFRNVCR